jgi:hypothetical protein
MNLELLLDKANRYLDARVLAVPKILEFSWQGMDFNCRYKEIDTTTSNLNFRVRVGRMPYSAENPHARKQLFAMSQTLIAEGNGRLDINIDGYIYFEGWTRVGKFDSSPDVIIETAIAVLKHRDLMYEIRPLTIRNQILQKIS